MVEFLCFAFVRERCNHPDGSRAKQPLPFRIGSISYIPTLIVGEIQYHNNELSKFSKQNQKYDSFLLIKKNSQGEEEKV